MNENGDRLEELLTSMRHTSKKKKVYTAELESLLQINPFQGYNDFFEAVQTAMAKGLLKAITNKKMNARTPALPQAFWLMPYKAKGSWSTIEMMKMNDLLSFTYYEKYPQFQTDEQWDKIVSVYSFLKEKRPHREVSIEERSLELFGHEKYLTDPKLFPAGPHFLARLGLSAGDIHAVSKSEPFIYWTKLGNNSQEIRNVLIVENLSFFHTAVSLLEEGNLDYNPELLIYGEGKKIERSLSFFCRQFPKNRPLFWYAGDLDPEGISIYIRLVEKFPEFRFALAVSIYERMLQHSSLANDAIGQINNGTYTELFLEEFGWELKQAMRQLLLKGKRIPQEVLTIETWKRGLS